MFFPYRDETKELNEDTRRSAGGAFISLPNGITHYEMGGSSPLLPGVPGDPQKSWAGGSGMRSPVVLIHGFSVPYFIYDPTFEFLSQSGFHVLRYDLFGRGFSDRPQARYDLDLFIQQLADLLDALNFFRSVNLVGLSMGGPIAAAFAIRHVERVDKLVLIDPLGAKPVTISPMLKAAKLPIVGEVGLSLIGSGSLVQNIASDFFDPALVEHFQAQYKIQMQYKGFKRAILSTIRNNMLGSFMDVYRALGKMERDILLFWGRNDTTVPFEHSNDLRAVLPQVEFHVIENCGHIPHYEKPNEVQPILLEFLRK
jgi:pimeloyl-ACP methyl ester carboxylesterase